MAADPEPAAWTAHDLEDPGTPITTPWDPDWIVLQPRQTVRTGTQLFSLDEVRVIVGSRHGG
jgi:hypothetical protein